jgi:hypothetical protein
MKELKKLLLVIALMIAFTVRSIQAQETINYETEYKELLVEYEDLLDDYDELLGDYEVSIEDYEELVVIYGGEIDHHELSKEQIELDQIEINMLRGSLTEMINMVDPRYFTVFLSGGLVDNKQLADVGISVQIPRVPFSVSASGMYLVDTGFGFKVGVGIRF